MSTWLTARWHLVALAALSLLSCAPLLVAAPPMQDYGAHVEMIAILHGLLTDDPSYTAHYALNPAPQPYLLTYALAAPLAALTSPDAALRLLCLLYLLATPAASVYLLRTFQRDEKLAILSLPIVHNTSFWFGFLPNALGYPLLLILIASAHRAHQSPTIKREAINALLLIALYFTHLSAALAFAAIGPALLLWHTRADLSATLRRGAYALPALTLAMLLQSQQPAAALIFEPHSLADALRTISPWLLRFSRTRYEFFIQGMMLLTLITTWLLPPRRPLGQGAPLLLCATSCALLYLAMPFTIIAPVEQVAASARLLAPIALLLVAASPANLSGRRAIALFPLTITALISLALLTHAAHEHSTRAQSAQRIAMMIPDTSRVLPITITPVHDGAFHEPYLHSVRRHTATRPILMAAGFSDPERHGVMPALLKKPLPRPDPDDVTGSVSPELLAPYTHVLLLSDAASGPEALPHATSHLEVIAHDWPYTLLRVTPSTTSKR
jgi:hypothetical protein